MMFERFTNSARQVIVQAQSNARELHHGFIGSEHLLLAVVSAEEPAAEVLRDYGLSPERVRGDIVRLVGSGWTDGLLSGLDRQALASIGIDLDAVRTRIEATFGPDALTRVVPPVRRRHRHLPGRKMRRRLMGRPARGAAYHPPGHPVRGHIPFTGRAKKSLERSLREAQAMGDTYVGVQHLALALLSMDGGMVPLILSAAGVSPAPLRAAILDRYRQAS